MSDRNIVQGWLPGDKRPYTYALLLPDGRAFYYGKGTGKRVFQHRFEATNKKTLNLYKSRVIRKLWASGEDYQAVILAYHATEEKAYLHEIALIFLSGDTLANLDGGGLGGTKGQPKPPRTEEHRRKISEGAKKRGVSEEARKASIEARKARKYNHSAETIHKIREANTGHVPSPEDRLKMSEAQKRRYESTVTSPETRRKLSEAGKRAWARRREQSA